MTSETGKYYLDYPAEEINARLGMVDDITAINAKIDKALSFRTETGVYEAAEDEATSPLIIPCTLDPKILVIEADRVVKGADGKTTYERILESNEETFVGAVGQMLTKLTPLEEATSSPMYPFYWCYMASTIDKTPTKSTAMFRNNGTKMQFGAPRRVAGRYNWTAYYWD